MAQSLTLKVNGKTHSIEIDDPDMPLLYALRDDLGLNNPRSAMTYGGLMGTVSGVTGGLAATDPTLVPYGALITTFHTGVGCLVGPSILYFTVRAFTGG